MQIIEDKIFEKLDYTVERFTKAEYESCEFIQCNFLQVDLSNAVFINCSFKNCDFTNAIFDQTNLEKVDLRTSYNYAVDITKNQVKKSKHSTIGALGLLDSVDVVVE